jgi:non-specific serine/threonine protein kinase
VLRAAEPEVAVIYEFAEFSFEPGEAKLLRAGHPLHVEPKALRVLEVLIERAGALVERDQLIDAVWRDVVVTPGTLTRLIAELRRAVGDDASDARFIATVHTRGYRWVAPIRRATSPATAARFALPERRVRLIGRDADLAQLCDQLRTQRLVTLAGPGGVGKTQLALEAARAEGLGAVERVWVDLSTALDAETSSRLVAGAVDAHERADTRLDVVIAAAIGDRALLLVLDNCERIVHAVSGLARTLLARCPRLTVLSTSQVVLDLPEEAVRWLAPLALPSDDWRAASRPIDALLEFDSVQLLVERARAVVPRFSIDAANAPALAEICRRLDGLPFALELAAARLASLTPQQLQRALDDRFAVLTRANDAVEGRQRSLRSAIEWTYALLDDAERDLLESLSVFAGSFSLDAAAAVAGSGSFGEMRVLDRVHSLTQKSLLAVDRGGEEARYRLLDSVHAFARERLAASGKASLASRRHAQFFGQLAEAADAELLQADQVVWFDRLVAEFPNLSAALHWSAAQASLEDRLLGAKLVIGLRFFFMQRSTYNEALVWCRLADGMSTGLAVRDAARLYNGVAITQLHATNIPEAQAAAARALELAKESHDAWEVAFALGLQAWCAALQGAHPDASAFSAAAIAAADAASDDWLRGQARFGRAFSALSRGLLDEALVEFERSAVHFERSKERMRSRFVAIYLALVHLLRGEIGASHSAAVRACGFDDSFASARTAAGITELTGYFAASKGEFELAARLLGAAARTREQHAAPLMRVWVVHHERALERSRAALGEERFRTAWKQGERSGAPAERAAALAFLAEHAGVPAGLTKS